MSGTCGSYGPSSSIFLRLTVPLPPPLCLVPVAHMALPVVLLVYDSLPPILLIMSGACGSHSPTSSAASHHIVDDSPLTFCPQATFLLLLCHTLSAKWGAFINSDVLHYDNSPAPAPGSLFPQPQIST